MSGHPVLDLGAAVRVLNDGQAWEIGVDHLDVDTYLAGGEAGGALLDLTPHLIEAQWVQGTGDAVNPDGVLPRAEAGTATLTLWDPTGEYMPPTGDPFGGVRPGRRIVLYERDSARNPVSVLWAGWVEQLEREAALDGPSTTVITAVDSITKLVNSAPTPPNARSPETAYERAVWASDVLTPGLPTLLDPAATAANVAGTQVGDSAWKTLVDAADVELGALFTLRDGTLVLLANSAGEFTSRWQATWKHGDRDALLPTTAWWVDAAYPTRDSDGLRDLTGHGRDALFGAGQIRVVDLETRFQVTVSPTPTTGTWTPPAVGDVLTVTRPQASEFHIHGTVLTSEQDGPYWTFTLTHDSYYWPGQPPPGTIVNVASLDWTTEPPGTPQWAQPECAPARISALTYDLASLRNDIHIRRRDTDSDLTPFTHMSDPQSVGHYGRWAWQWDGSPHDDAAGEARSAALTLSAYALPRAVYAALEVNVTAAANTPHAGTLLDLVRTVNLSNTITAHADGRTALARVYGWDWTWTAAGGLSGQVTLGRPPGAPTAGLWFVGIAGMSELDDTTVLA